MTSREIVRMSLAYASPPRIPFGMGGVFPSDFQSVLRKPAPNRPQQDWTRRAGHWTMIDEWGNEWRRIEDVTMGEVHRGVIEENWDLLDSYVWPDVSPFELYEEAAALTAQHHREGYYVLAPVKWPFGVARNMRRMEVFLADCAEEPERVRHLLSRVADVIEVEINRYADIGVDCLRAGEDWGTQERLLVSPAMFRDLFKPVFKRLCGVAHSRGMSVRFHSCGFVRDVIEDWIEVGIDVCQFDQIELHGIDFLAEHFGGRMHFWSPVDIQKTLQTRDHALIENAARDYVEKLAGPFGGGFIAGMYGAHAAIGIEREYEETACRAFMKYGDPAPWAR